MWVGVLYHNILAQSVQCWVIVLNGEILLENFILILRKYCKNAKVCKVPNIVQKCAKSSKSAQSSANGCFVAQKYAKLCESVPKVKQVWESVPKVEKVC